MFNSTFLSLSIISACYPSSFYTICHLSNCPIRSSFYNSRFSYMFSNVVLSYTENHRTTIRSCQFAHSLNSPLKFDSKSCKINSTSLDKIEMPIQHITISSSNFSTGNNKGAEFIDGCGDIQIYFCTFLSCKSTSGPGGSIYIKQLCSTIIYNTFFKDSSSNDLRGGTILAIQSFCNKQDDFVDPGLTQLNVEYCCFSECYNSKTDECFGINIFSSADTTIFHYSSAVNCPPYNHNIQSKGAQFDLQAESVKSKNVNITDGYSKYCSGIEYRNAHNGCFKFQTITNIRKCMFASSLTSVDINGLELSYSNYNNITLQNNAQSNDNLLKPGIIHIRKCDLRIKYFYFTNIQFSNSGGRIVTRGTEHLYDKDPYGEEKIKIYFENCYRDSSVGDSQIASDLSSGSQYVIGTVVKTEKQETYKIPQLDLEDCAGVYNPGDVIIIEGMKEPTEYFTESFHFSYTADFTESIAFSDSSDFTKSSNFPQSEQFTKSLAFSKTGEFTQTGDFSKTDDFSKTLAFSMTDNFSQSFYFTFSDYFSKTGEFTKTTYFTQTNEFSKTDAFSQTGFFSTTAQFSRSDFFSKTDKFSRSNFFSKTDCFTKTDGFSKTSYFSKTFYFSNSQCFSKSEDFTKTGYFSYPSELISSVFFSKSSDFTKTDYFSKTGYFSNSQYFSKSDDFSFSDYFTLSNELNVSFSDTLLFSMSNIFSPSMNFPQSTAFSMSKMFTNSKNLFIQNM